MQKKEYVLLSAVIVNTSGLLKQEIMKKLHYISEMRKEDEGK